MADYGTRRVIYDRSHNRVGCTIVEGVNGVAGYDRGNNLVGRYYPDSDRTYDRSGSLVGDGDHLVALIYEANDD